MFRMPSIYNLFTKQMDKGGHNAAASELIGIGNGKLCLQLDRNENRITCQDFTLVGVAYLPINSGMK